MLHLPVKSVPTASSPLERSQLTRKNRAGWSSAQQNVIINTPPCHNLKKNTNITREIFFRVSEIQYPAMDEEYHVYTRIEDITEQDDKYLAGAKKEIRNDLTVIIPENPFPDIEVDAYPPLKFSWVIPKKLAAMAFPRNKENLNFLVNQGITHLVTLTAGKKPPVDDVARLRWSEVPVEEFTPPSLDQIKKFIDICKKSDKNGEVMGIHCRQGRSRSGVMLACYLIHFHRFEPDQAMNVIRMIRPGSIDSEEQEEAVGRYFEYLTEDNPLKFGVSSEVLEEFIQTARDSTKAMLS